MAESRVEKLTALVLAGDIAQARELCDALGVPLKLDCADLSGANLSEADLTKADLTDANRKLDAIGVVVHLLPPPSIKAVLPSSSKALT